jgi:hypothetical protein
VVESLGSAIVTGGDAQQARKKALDDALRKAVSQSLEVMVDPAVLAAQAELFQKRIFRQGQRYVTTFRVRDEGEVEGVYHVHLDSTMDLAALRRDVAAIEPLSSSPRAVTRPVTRPKLVLLAVFQGGPQDDQAPRATFGQDGHAGTTADALRDALSAIGFEILYAEGLPVSVVTAGALPEGGLPLTDAQALALAQQVGAGGAIVARVATRGQESLRATSWVGAERELALRVLDAASPSSPVASLSLADVAVGPDAASAGHAATQAVIRRAAFDLAPLLAARWPKASPQRGSLAVHVRAVTRWLDVETLIRSLAASPGVGEVVVRQAARHEIALALRGDVTLPEVERVVAQTALAGRRLSVISASKESGVTVEVGEAPAIPSSLEVSPP